MFFYDEKKKLQCTKCSYVAYPPYPKICPKCMTPFFEKGTIEKISDISNSEKQDASLEFAKLIKTKVNPEIVRSTLGEQVKKSSSIGTLEASKVKLSDTDDRITIIQKKGEKFDFSQDKILLGNETEYLRYIGVVTLNRNCLYTSNPKYAFLLELVGNVHYIASSILTGELDRMRLVSLDGSIEEFCYFNSTDPLIYILYGNFPDKKAIWLLNQMKIAMQEILAGKLPDQLEKQSLEIIHQQYHKRLHYLLMQFMALQELFTPRKITSVDSFLCVDYFGLSFQSIGVISKLITDRLVFAELPHVVSSEEEDEEESINELKEALLTAKIEAIAANTLGTTSMLPSWISVKLGFQRYRYILFAKIRDYYITLLTEGNLELKEPIITDLIQILNNITQNPFIGDLTLYKALIPEITTCLQRQNRNISINPPNL